MNALGSPGRKRVLLCAFQLFNVQMLLHSGIGTPYDPLTGQGQIGRNFTHQTMSSALGFFDKDKYNFNPFISAPSIGMCIDEFNGDSFDHGPLGFVGGGYTDAMSFIAFDRLETCIRTVGRFRGEPQHQHSKRQPQNCS
jgi:hypothetical protein